jgi:hypothetical protein
MRQLGSRALKAHDALYSDVLRKDAARHARLFEMIRQQSLAERALWRLHLQSLSQDRPPMLTPSSLYASFEPQPASDDTHGSSLS